MSNLHRGAVFLFLILLAAIMTGCAEKYGAPEEQEEAETEEEPAGAVIQYKTESAILSEGKELVLFQQPCENGFLALINRKTGEDLPADWEETEGFVNDGRYDRYESTLFLISENGSKKEVRRYRPASVPEQQEEMEDYFSEMRPGGFCMREDGSFVALERSYECWKERNETRTKNAYYVRLLRSSGTEISRNEIETEGNALACNRAVYLGKDIIAAPNGNEILFFGVDGKKRFSVSTTFTVHELCRTEEGKLAAILQDGESVWISVINALDGTVTVPDRLPTDAHDFCGNNSGDVLFYIRNSEVFQYDLNTGESVRLVSLLNLGILPASVGAFFADSDNGLHFVIHEWKEDKETICELYKKAIPEAIQTEKQPLSIGFLEISLPLQEKLIQFNEQSEDAYLEALDFRNISESAFYAMPSDILIMDEAAYDRISLSGTLADLTGFLKDDAVSWEESLLPSVLNALKDGTGTLRRVSSHFRIESMACTEDTAERLTPFTPEQLLYFSEQQGAGQNLYEPFYTSERLLKDLYTVNSRMHKDEEALGASLYASLEDISRRQPQQYAYGFYAADPASTERRMMEGRVAMMQAHIGSLEDFKWYDAFFEEKACFIGWPTEEGSRSQICFDESVGISAVCTEQEQQMAWQFLRRILNTEETDNSYGFPVTVQALEKQMKLDMQAVAYRKDDDGKFELDREGNRIEIPRSTWYSPEWKKHQVLALKPEQREKLLALIETGV